MMEILNILICYWTVYEYVPFCKENVIVFVVDDAVVPLRVTDRFFPCGNLF